MQQASIEQEIPADQQEEWERFHTWAAESRSIEPFLALALLWHAGHLTIDEGRRIETDQKIAHFLKSH